MMIESIMHEFLSTRFNPFTETFLKKILSSMQTQNENFKFLLNSISIVP